MPPGVPRRSSRQPSGGLLFGAYPIVESLSNDGFAFDLSGVTDSAGYSVDYLLL